MWAAMHAMALECHCSNTCRLSICLSFIYLFSFLFFANIFFFKVMCEMCDKCWVHSEYYAIAETLDLFSGSCLHVVFQFWQTVANSMSHFGSLHFIRSNPNQSLSGWLTSV